MSALHLLVPLGCPIGTEIKKCCVVTVIVIVTVSVAVHRVSTLITTAVAPVATDSTTLQLVVTTDVK